MADRIYEIAKKYGFKNTEVLKKARSLGVHAANVPSSLLDKFSTNWLEAELLKDYPDKGINPT